MYTNLRIKGFNCGAS